VDIFHMNAVLGNDDRAKTQLKCQQSHIPSVLVTTPNVGGTGQNLTAANHAVITQKFWVLYNQRQVFAQVVWLGKTEYHTHGY
jgi:hypothetical protein